MPFADVLVDLPGVEAFSYRIPRPLQGRIAVGQRVWVPLRHRRIVGCVVALHGTCRVHGLKPLDALIDPEPLLPPELLPLSRWMADRYVLGWGQALHAMWPSPIRRGRTEMTSRQPWRPPEVVPTTAAVLTKEQAQAAERVAAALEAARHETFLLHGVTSSGKTEVYLHAISHLLQRGGGSIVLVPEIALTPQTIERFTARFGPDRVAVLHSRMRESHRFQEWSRIARGEARVVVGARSAVFAPVRRLRLIVVDEEQDASYKQEEAPRYHARDVAVARARLVQGIALLGSATPSLESAFRARHGDYTYLALTARIDQRPLPTVQIVDLGRQGGGGRRRILSYPLESAIAKTLQDGQQVIILLNRRGYATVIQCPGCGIVVHCPDCDTALTFHQATGRLLCHACRAQSPVPTICPGCQGPYVRFRGVGTQRVENELARAFPTARLARMDTDAMRPHARYDAVLEAFRRGEIQILVGTQMVAKGHDFPNVTLIGIISADTALHLPDFRAAERTFALLTQVAGRAGRGSAPGHVIIQTALPTHYAITAASRHDYDAFYRRELAFRRPLQLPPFTEVAQLIVTASRAATAEQAAAALAERLRGAAPRGVTWLGPSPAHRYRLRRQYRWQLIVKAKTPAALAALLAPFRRGRPSAPGARLIINVDPHALW